MDKAFNEAWAEIQKHGHERGWLGIAEAAWRAALASQEAAPPAAVPAPSPVPLFDRKLANLEQRGYEVIGRILHKDGEYALFDGSCRWLDKPKYDRLMHEQDGSLFATPRSPAAERFFANLPNESRAVPAPDGQMKLDTALWCDLKMDKDRSNWLLMGRGYATGVCALAIQNELAMAYHRLSQYQAAAPAQAVDALRSVAEEAATVLESAAAHNRKEGRTVLAYTQQDRANRLRAALAAQPAAPAGEPVAWLESEESASRTPIKEVMRGMFRTAVWHFSERPQTNNPVWTLHAPVANAGQAQKERDE